MIINALCPCGNIDSSLFYEYDGCLGYEAIVCKCCGRYSDYTGMHQANEWSEAFIIKVAKKAVNVECGVNPDITTGNKRGSYCESCGKLFRKGNIYGAKGHSKRYKQWLGHNAEVRISGLGATVCWSCWKESAVPCTAA